MRRTGAEEISAKTRSRAAAAYYHALNQDKWRLARGGVGGGLASERASLQAGLKSRPLPPLPMNDSQAMLRNVQNHHKSFQFSQKHRKITDTGGDDKINDLVRRLR